MSSRSIKGPRPHREKMEKGDTIIDGGNSMFKDDVRRSKMLEPRARASITTSSARPCPPLRQGPSVVGLSRVTMWTEALLLSRIHGLKASFQPFAGWRSTE